VLVILPHRGARPALRISLEPLLQWMVRYRTGLRALALAVALGCVAIVAAPGGPLIQAESDLTVMHPRPNAALDTETEIARRFGVAPGVLLLHLEAADEAELIALAYQVQARLAQSSVTDAGIAGTYGLANWLPDPAVARARLAAIRPGDGERAATDFAAAARQNGFNPAAMAGYEVFLRLLMQPTGYPGIKALRRYPGLARDFLPRRGDVGPAEAITIIFLRGNLDERGQRDAAIDAVQSALSGLNGTVLTGLPVISRGAEQAVGVELPRLLWIAMALVAGYLLVHFRNIRWMALSLLPAAFGFLTLAALVRIAGIRLNLMNLISLPLLIGIDVDYGIYLVSLARRGNKNSSLAGGAHAVCVCATSMIAGYGSLIFTSVPALRSLGLVVAAGAAMCLAGAIFILCPLLASGKLDFSQNEIASEKLHVPKP
jgi:predicted exporter